MSLQQMAKDRIKYLSPRCGGIAAGAVEAGVEIVKTNISDPQEIEAVIKALEAAWVHFDHVGDGFAVRTG